MLYKTADKFGLTLDQVRTLFPAVSFPASGVVAMDEVQSYTETPTPTYDSATQSVREVAPVGGVQRWEIYPLPTDEASANLHAAAEAVKRSIVDAVQQRLDEFARTRNYDSILSACTYATSTVPKFAAEGQYCVEARDATWAALYAILAEVEAGTRTAPSGYADIEQDLPALAWPA